MRNYVSVYFTYWKVNATNTEGWGTGDGQDVAHGVALTNASQYGGGVPDIITDLGRYYFPLSQSILGSALALTQTNPKDGPWNLQVALQNSFELDPGVSPLKQGDYPYNPKGKGAPVGRKGTGRGGTQQMSLYSYLVRLRDTWQSGLSVAGSGVVPQRWIEWLTLLISHYARYTPTQIYGFLSLVDFSKPTFRV